MIGGARWGERVDERGTVIFDLDGTLVDSAPDLAGALDALMQERDLRPFGVEGTRALIGHGIPALVQGAMERRGARADDAVVARFTTLYMGRLSQETRCYPGARAAIARLAKDNWRLTVCTNKREEAARAILSDLGIAGAFAVVAGPDTFGVGKPDPEHLRRTLPEGRPMGYRAIMVGDSEIDVTTARAAGLPVIACAWGYAHRPVGDLGADRVAERFGDVPDLIRQLIDPP